MADTKSTGQPEEETVVLPDATDLLKQLVSGFGTLESRLKAMEDRLSTATPTPTPTPTSTPVVQAPQVSQYATPQQRADYVRSLEAYAAQQATEAKRLQLARKYGLEPEELTGEYPGGPGDMEASAKLLAQEKRLKALEQALEAKAKAPQETAVPEPPQGSPGGPTTLAAPLDEELAALRQEAQQHRGTPQGQFAALEAAYRDPSKRITGTTR